MTREHWLSIFIGFMFFAILNRMPFADAAKYRQAIEHCERSLPRDQHCTVIGVPK